VSGRRGAIIEHEMGCSAAEFARTLPSAMRDWRVGGGPLAWQVCAADGMQVAKIAITPAPARAMGSLSLPVLKVRLDLSDTPGPLAAEFLRRFERGFHRGGG
jgi:hypothetical protein